MNKDTNVVNFANWAKDFQMEIRSKAHQKVFLLKFDHFNPKMLFLPKFNL